MTVAAVDRSPSRLPWIAVGAAWLVGLGALLSWLLGNSTGALREQLKVLQFWSLEVTLFAALVSGVCIFRQLARECSRSDGIRLLLLAALAIGLTVFVAPRTNRIFYDEQIYQSVGQNMADTRLAQVCNDGSVEYGRLQCSSGEYNKQPYGYPHWLSVAYRLFGLHESTAFAVNAAVMGLTVCGVYLLGCVLFHDRQAALLAGLLLALTPQQLIWSATAAVEPSASLAAVVALLCAAHYSRSGGTAALVATAVASAYAVQFRPESILILPVISMLIWPRLRGDLASPSAWWVVILFFLLVAVHLGHLFAVRNVPWGTDAPRFSLQYVPGNLRVNGPFYLYDERFPLVFSLLAILGLMSPGFKKERLAVAAYFLLFFAITLVFYAGSYNYGADVRYSLMTYPPIAVLGGLGAARLGRAIQRRMTGVPAFGLVVAAVAFQFLWYAPVVRATTEEAWAARADVRFAQALASELPRNSYVLTHNPGMFHLWGVNAGQMSRVASNPRYGDFLASRYSGGVYVHWNFWCNVRDPIQPEFCRQALAMRPVELVREYKERDQRFALYRMKNQHE
jgi:Dolichyl-phosphate-mannose-protein mannosyltransferase